MLLNTSESENSFFIYLWRVDVKPWQSFSKVTNCCFLCEWRGPCNASVACCHL